MICDIKQINLIQAQDKLVSIALARTGGRRQEAASLLGWSKTAFRNRLHRRLEFEKALTERIENDHRRV